MDKGALSATWEREGDPEGSAAILDYFGQVLKPPFTLKDANPCSLDKELAHRLANLPGRGAQSARDSRRESPPGLALTIRKRKRVNDSGWPGPAGGSGS
jgi:hypothetical protein